MSQFSAIMLKSLKLSNKDLKNLILACDSNDERLPPSKLEQIINALPKEDIILQVAEHTNDCKKLVETEQFLVKVCTPS